MKLLAIADLHGHYAELARVAAELRQADVLVLVGDITRFNSPPDVPALTVALRRFTHAIILGVAGNCDHPRLEVALADAGWSLHRCCRVVEEIAFIGLGGSLPCPGPTPNEYSEAALAASLAEGAAGVPAGAPVVLVSHQPPRDTTVDRIHSGAHVGSQAVREFIEQHQPRLCLTGHIHEGRGTDRLGQTPILNPGPLAQGGYVWAELTVETCVAELRRA